MFHPNLTQAPAALATSLILCGLAAQNPAAAPQPATADVLAASGIRAATTQSLPFQSNDRRSFHARVVLAGRTRVLQLHPHSLRAPDYQLLVDDGNGVRPTASSKAATYQGTVLGLADSQVAISLWNGQLTGQVHLDGGSQTWNIEPVTRFVSTAHPRQHLIYHQNDGPKWTCGGGQHPNTHQVDVPKPANSSSAAVINQCEIAIDSENEFYKQNGSSSTRTQNAAEAIMNAMDVIYRRDLEICYSITTQIVRTTKVYQNGPNVGCISGPNLLSEMQTRWNANHVGVRRDIATMFSGGQPTNNIAGCAFVGVICNQTAGYGVSNARGAFSGTLAVATHEIGHNWSLNHCGDPAPCNVMCGGCLDFGPNDTAQVYRYKAGRTCLGVCSGCRYDAEYSYFGAGCAGTGSGSGPACVQVNWNQTNKGVSWGRLDFAFAANSGSQARSIESVDFYCGASAPVSIPVDIYAATSNGAPGAVLGSATMQVRGPNAAYRATFSSPVLIPANTDFFVGVKSPAAPFFAAPASASGTQVQEYWRNAGRWNLGSGNTFNYRINCTSAGARPLLSSERPKVGTTYRVSVAKARPGAICAVLRSASSTSLDLTAAGAPGCTLFLDPAGLFLTQNATTNGSGVASFSLPIPNNSVFCGATWFEQIAIQEPSVNRLGWVVTRRGQPTVGN